MKILLLGSNGQLGSDIQAEKPDTIEITCATRSDIDVSDVQKLEDYLKNIQYDVLINCTSFHKTDEVEDNANTAMDINAFAVRSMAKSCKEKQAKLIHISTDYVFDGLNQTTAYKEGDAVGPLNVYGASKVLGENLALSNHDQCFILRVASLFGEAGASGKGGNFVETMIKVGSERGELNVVDDIRMSPTSTKTIARTIFALLENKATPGIYHVVNSGNATWFEFACEIIALSKTKAKVSPCTSDEFPTKALRPSYSVLDNSKVIETCGPIPSWQEALKEYLTLKGY